MIRSNSSYRGDLQQGATAAHASEQQPLQDGEPPRGSAQAYRGQLHIEIGGREDGALQLCAQLGSGGTIQTDSRKACTYNSSGVNHKPQFLVKGEARYFTVSYIIFSGKV